MLQKSKSKTIAKFKFLVLVPLMLVMLTYVSCSEDNPLIVDEEKSIILEVRDLKESIEKKEKLTVEEYQLLKSLEEIYKDKIEIIEVVETQNISEVILNTDVPFAVIDQVPVFSGCEDLGSNEEQKNCVSEKITEFVSANFDADLGKELGLTGVNRVIVQFKIDKNGYITDVRSRAPHPDLEDEAERVINSLPQMQPGQQNGQNVGVMYSLPIVFQVNE